MAVPRWKQHRIEWFRANRRRLDAAFRGLSPREIRALSREEAIAQVRLVRDAWEALTSRCQDLSDEGLAAESTREVKARLASYSSLGMRAILADWLIDVVKDLTK